MIFEMPRFSYSADALAPKMSEETLHYHIGMHLQTYVNNLNRLKQGTFFDGMPLEEIVCKATGAVWNNAAQVWNHTFFFETLTPLQSPMPAAVAKKLSADFGSVEAFQEAWLQAATSLFGSGWTWLVREKSGKLAIKSYSNAGNPLQEGLTPLLTVDVWEHAYYIDYRNRRADFVKAALSLTDWELVAERWRKESEVMYY